MKRLLIAMLLANSMFGYGQVRLNEMQSSNSTTIVDDYGENDDWVEIYNPTSDSIEVGGLVLKDQIDTWAIPTGNPATHLPPDGYLLLWADDQEGQGIFHTNFKLASGGEFLGLYANDSVTVIDSVTIPALSSDHSFIRCNEGWTSSNAPSPLTQNNCPASIQEHKSVDDLFNFAWDDNGTMVIHMLEDTHLKYDFSLYAMDGKKLAEAILEQKKTTLDLKIKQTGTYFVIISNDNTSYSKRVLLSK